MAPVPYRNKYTHVSIGRVWYLESTNMILTSWLIDVPSFTFSALGVQMFLHIRIGTVLMQVTQAATTSEECP